MKFVKPTFFQNIRFCKFYRSSESMRSSISARTVTLYFPFDYDATIEWERSRKFVTVAISQDCDAALNKLHTSPDWCREKLRRKKLLRFVTATSAPLGDFDKVSQLDSSRWHSTFYKW